MAIIFLIKSDLIRVPTTLSNIIFLNVQFDRNFGGLSVILLLQISHVGIIDLEEFGLPTVYYLILV